MCKLNVHNASIIMLYSLNKSIFEITKKLVILSRENNKKKGEIFVRYYKKLAHLYAVALDSCYGKITKEVGA